MATSGQLGNVTFQQASGPLGAPGGSSPTPTFNSVNVNNLPSYQVVYPDQNNQLTSDANFVRNPILTNSSGTGVGLLVRSTRNTSGTAGYSALDVDTTTVSAGSGVTFLQRWLLNGSTLVSFDSAGNANISGAVSGGSLTSGSTLQVNASVLLSASVITAAGTSALPNSATILVDATLGNVNITLPLSTANFGASRIVSIKKIDSSANTVTLTCSGAELIDGSATKVISTQYTAVQLAAVSSRTAWYITSAN